MVAFADYALHHGDYKAKMYFGMVGENLANRILQDTGYNFYGKNVSLRADNIRKINKDHGNEKTERPRGQEPIKSTDFVYIPEVISEADTISRSEYDGKPAAVFVKTIDGRRFTVYAVDSGKSSIELFVQTMYKGIKKGA